MHCTSYWLPKKSEVDIKTSVANIDLTGNLIVEKVYYHNVAEYHKQKKDGILNVFDKDKELWVEYTGTVELGIDLTKVKVTLEENKVHVFIPKAKIFKLDIIQNGEQTYKIYDSDKGLLDGNDLTMEDSTKAIDTAQKEMKSNVSKDTQLLRTAQIRSKNLIEERVKQMIDLNESEYDIIWDLEENG